MIKKVFVLFLFSTLIFCCGYKTIDKYVIRAEKDAFYHNNVGLNYLKDRTYYAAIQEFKIAISLSPSTQATAIFQNNLGDTYMFIGYPEMARTCYEDALRLYGLNFRYYINLIQCYKALGIINSKKGEYQASTDVYDKIKLGVLYIETGEIRRGLILLDEICIEEPDLLITPSIRQYLKDATEKLK